MFEAVNTDALETAFTTARRRIDTDDSTGPGEEAPSLPDELPRLKLRARNASETTTVEATTAEVYLTAREYDPVGTELALAVFYTARDTPESDEEALSRVLARLLMLEHQASEGNRCGICGSSTIATDEEERAECQDCGHQWSQQAGETVASTEAQWQTIYDRGREHAPGRDSPPRWVLAP